MAVISYIFNNLVQIYIFIIFLTVVMSWLIGFNVISKRNQLVDAVWRTCAALTEPPLRQIRRFLPNMGGIDISPIILLVLVGAVQIGVNQYVLGPLSRVVP
jgi:YggT family protein